MRRPTLRRLAIVAALALASCASPRPSPGPPIVPKAPEAGDVSGPLVAAHNARRARAGLPPLTVSPILTASAAGHARDMAARRKMGHKGSDGSSPFDRMTRLGYSYRSAAENVAYGFDDVDSVMDGWMRSPGHRRNILGNFSEIGVARAIAPDGASYWCATFGTPSAP